MSEKKTLAKDLTKGSVSKTLLMFAWPVMLSNLLQTAYNMIDMVIVGRFSGSAGLSAVSTGGDILHFYTFISMGFATAGQIMISQYVGAGKKDELNGVIGTLFTFVLSLGLVLMILSFIFAEPFLHLLNVPAEAYEGARAYILCCSAGMMFIFGYNTVSAALRGMGDSKHPMIFIGIAAILNTILDLFFISSLHMGAFGAALATVIAQGLSFILSIIYLYQNREAFGFDFKPSSFRPVKGPTVTLLKLGVPIAIQHSAGSISALFVSSYINSYGVVASAVTGVGNKMNSIALIVANALNTSGSSVIGQCFGAGNTKRVKSVVGHVFCFDLIFVSILAVIILNFPEQVFGIFNSDAAVLEMSHIYAPVAAIAFIGYAFRSPCLAFINGLGNSKMNFLMGVVEGFVLRIGLCILLGVTFGFGIQGFWYGSTVASYGYGMVIFPYFFSNVWTKRKTVVSR